MALSVIFFDNSDSGRNRRFKPATLSARGIVFWLGTVLLALAPPVQRLMAQNIPPLITGDETIVVTEHHIQTAHGVLNYEARAGRLPIRNDETGEVRGYAFFVAYVVKQDGGKPRPLTFLWNGGPTTNSILVHTEVFGPRRITAAGMVDNAETPLTHSDLVFYDPIDTGFSRPARPEYDKEFLSVLGDFAATAEFIRAYRVKFHAEEQPLFLGGESYGTWRVCGTTELLTKRGVKIAGVMLISGGVPGSLMPGTFQDAMYVPARTAAAFELKKLAPDLMRDKAAAMKAVGDWTYDVYMPALTRLDQLTPAERDRIATDLAHYIGVRPDQIDRKTLVMSNVAYRNGLFDGDKNKVLNQYDMRIMGAEHEAPGRVEFLTSYLRGELSYNTDIAYTGLEDGYMPLPGPARRSTGERFVYNHVDITPEAMARMQAGGGPPLSQPWLQNAMRINKDLKVYVAAGRYDSLNMCEGNLHMSAKLEPDLARRFTQACYEGGHMMYRDQPTRLQLSDDLARFLKDASGN
jgi:carboxypeptidase C (cathepsin A)